jgi:alkylated DNA repair dioxygenase AlkB
MRHWYVAHERARGLFDEDLPPDLRYQPDFISSAEESALLGEISRVEFSTFEMHGVAARRRVAFFGHTYDAGKAPASSEMPPFLLDLRGRVARWAGAEDAAFVMALINEYPPGAPIGWHRDAPQYGIVAGVSLLSSCLMKFRPYVTSQTRPSTPRRRTATHEITLERRSSYLMAGDARSAYEHHIPAVSELRYSITFRTLRGSSTARNGEQSVGYPANTGTDE